jgi:hypothetical protein
MRAKKLLTSPQGAGHVAVAAETDATGIQSRSAEPAPTTVTVVICRWHASERRSQAVSARSALSVTSVIRREREKRPEAMRFFVASLRALLEGRREESLEATEKALAHFRDAEAQYYLARQLARLGARGGRLSRGGGGLHRGRGGARARGPAA